MPLFVGILWSLALCFMSLLSQRRIHAVYVPSSPSLMWVPLISSLLYFRLFFIFPEKHARDGSPCTAVLQRWHGMSVNCDSSASAYPHQQLLLMFTDRVSRECKAIGSVRLSVRLSVSPSFCLFPLCLLNRLTFDLEFFQCEGHDYISPGIESQGHRSRLKINAVTPSVWPWSSIEDSFFFKFRTAVDVHTHTRYQVPDTWLSPKE